MTRPKPRYQPGDRIGGRYKVHEVKMGGMGEVYLCFDQKEQYPYALKTFQQRYLNAPRLRKVFEEEVTTWVGLEKHPNIVHCYWMSDLDNQPFMILDWIFGDEGKGADLRSWLRYGSLDIPIALNVVIDICRGLNHAQKKQPGLVHRDLKPDNILVAEGRLAKVTDFGLAQIVESAGLEIEGEADGRQSLVGKGGITGTPAYMAPEQWRGEVLDERTDIYAIGCILFEILTGQQPFHANGLDRLKQQHLNGKIPVLNGQQSYPNSLKEVLAYCLAKRREDRFNTLNSLFEQLVSIYQEQFGELPRNHLITDEYTALDYSNRGSTYDRLKQYDRALTDYGMAINLDPEFAATYSNRSATYRNLKQYDKAIADCDQAILLNPEMTSAYTNRGLIYHDLKQYNNALADYNHALELDPNNPRIYASRANVYAGLQQHEQALNDYSMAIRLKPNEASVYLNRGNFYSDIGKYEQALVDFNRAIELGPVFVKAYSDRGQMYNEIHQPLKALADLNRAIRLDPNFAPAYSNRGITHRSLGKHDLAITQYQ